VFPIDEHEVFRSGDLGDHLFPDCLTRPLEGDANLAASTSHLLALVGFEGVEWLHNVKIQNPMSSPPILDTRWPVDCASRVENSFHQLDTSNHVYDALLGPSVICQSGSSEWSPLYNNAKEEEQLTSRDQLAVANPGLPSTSDLDAEAKSLATYDKLSSNYLGYDTFRPLEIQQL
jgi:hypothetical protein